MTEPIIIDGKQYEQHPFNGLMEGWIALKPLPKQPEEEKKQSYWTYIESYAGNVLRVESVWTKEQAQLAAAAVKTLLQYIQEDIDNWTNLHEAVEAAHHAIANEEKGE